MKKILYPRALEEDTTLEKVGIGDIISTYLHINVYSPVI